MKRISVIAAAALAVLAATGAHARSLDAIQKDGTLRVATEGYYAPFAYFEGKKLTGFEVDLTELMTQKMGLKLEWKTISFDALLTGLKQDRWDLVISSHGITPEREKQVLFSTPYYDNSALFVGQQGKFTSIDQLKGKKVGVQNGTTHQKFITDKHPEITTVPYDSYQNAKLDLQNGRIDAVFGDTAVVTEWLKSNPKLAAVGDKVTDKAYFGTGLGIAVRQGNTDLQQKFNAALEKVKKDGTYQTIYNKWFQK